MPSNSTGTIAIWRDATAVATLKLSLQDTGVRVRAVPAGGAGTTVSLPANGPIDGDAYEVIDADGSSSTAKPITIVPPVGTTIRGAATFVLEDAFAGVRLTFDATTDDWTAEESAGGGSASVDAPWHDVAAGTVFQSSSATPYVSCDSTAAQSTVKLDPAPFDGQVQTVRLTGTTQVTPVLVLPQGAGITVEDVITPGVFDGAGGTFLAIQCEIASWKFDKATKQWKLYAHTIGSAAAAVNATAWAIDYVAGINTNSGAPGSPVAAASEIVRRWQGGVPGTRPKMPAGAYSVTVTGDAPNFSDPLCVLWDIDVAPGFTLVVDGQTTVKRAGAITAVPNAFARTSTGQQTITDPGVVDWTADVDQPIVDTVSGAFAWVVIGGANGTVSAAYLQSTNAAGQALALFNGGLGAAAIGTHAYQILRLPQVYFGQAANLRTIGPGAGSFSPTVMVRRLHGLSQNINDFHKSQGDANKFFPTVDGSLVVFVECSRDQGFNSPNGCSLLNCAGSTNANDTLLVVGSVLGGNSTRVFAGYARHKVSLSAGSFFDQDFQMYGVGKFQLSAAPAGAIFIGAVGRFLDGGAANVFIEAGFTGGSGSIQITSLFAGVACVYGTTGGSVIADIGESGTGGAINLFSTDTAANTFKFDTLTFKINGSASAWGFNEATGLFVGPTTLTTAHLDAALGAGTGFGNTAIDPLSGGTRIAVSV
jgi:hypothetical protein